MCILLSYSNTAVIKNFTALRCMVWVKCEAMFPMQHFEEFNKFTAAVNVCNNSLHLTNLADMLFSRLAKTLYLCQLYV